MNNRDREAPEEVTQAFDALLRQLGAFEVRKPSDDPDNAFPAPDREVQDEFDHYRQRAANPGLPRPDADPPQPDSE